MVDEQGDSSDDCVVPNMTDDSSCKWTGLRRVPSLNDLQVPDNSAGMH